MTNIIEKTEETKNLSRYSRKDWIGVWWRWLWFYYVSASYLSYYGVCFGWSMSPILKKLYKPKSEEMKAAIARQTSFYITEAGFGMAVHGMMIAMEEAKAAGEEIPDESFVNMKSALMGPIAGFGDSMMDSILRTLLIAVTQPLAASGLAISLIGPFLKAIAKPVVGAVMLPLGYKMGSTAIEDMLDNGMFQKIMSGAAVLSMFIMGSMSATYVTLTTPLKFGSIKLQDIINTALPGALPLAVVLLCYWLINKKQVSMVKIIIGIMIACLVLSFIGIV